MIHMVPVSWDCISGFILLSSCPFPLFCVDPLFQPTFLKTPVILFGIYMCDSLLCIIEIEVIVLQLQLKHLVSSYVVLQSSLIIALGCCKLE